MSAALSDRAARLSAQTEFSSPLLLEAGAGSGKTTVLVARVLAWILGCGWERQAMAGHDSSGRPLSADEIAGRTLGRVVAITFTEAAAAEMAQRIGEALAEVAAGSLPEALLPEALGERSPADLAQRATSLLAALERLRVGTIHALARGLLAAYPLEANLHPRFEIDAGGDRLRELIEATAEELLVDAYRGAGPESPLLRLAARRIGPADLAMAAEEFVARGGRAADLEPDPLTPEAMAPLGHCLVERCTRLVEVVAGRLTPHWYLATACEIAEFAGLAVEVATGGLDRGGIGRLVAFLSSCTPAFFKRLREWEAGRLTKRFEKEAFGGAEADLARACRGLPTLVDHLKSLDLDLLDGSRRVLQPLLAEIERRQRYEGFVTFDDLLFEAVRLLRDRPAVRREVVAAIDQLLVDEFQDTDGLQCQLVRLLALDGPEPRPDLFVVGDPKQSIYGWRRADLAAYDEFAIDLEKAGGRRERLDTNFRSTPAILAEVERTVGPRMMAKRGVQPAFAPLVADRAPGPGGEPEIEYWSSSDLPAVDGRPATTRVGAAEEREARAVAADLLALRRRVESRGEVFEWQRCALLFRALTGVERYLEALRDADIPFTLESDRDYFRRREILEVSSLVRAVLDPLDALALVAWLRSPWVGVPDGALLPLWLEGLPGLLADLRTADPQALAAIEAAVRRAEAAVEPDPLGAGLLPDWPSSLLAAIADLGAAREEFRQQASDRFVERLLQRFQPEPLAASRYLGGHRLAQVERFFRDLVPLLEAACGDPAAALRSLRRAVAEQREEEATAPQEAGAGAVRILTIHKAKGLGFPYVYLLQLHHGSAGRRAEHDLLGRSEREGAAYRLFGAPTPNAFGPELERQERADAEQLRLLYVAMTRARDRLVLAGNWDGSPRGEGRAMTLLDLVRASRGEALGLLRSGAGRAAPQDRLLWRTLAADEPPLLARDREPIVAPPAGADFALLAQRFAQRRAEAGARQARSLLGPVKGAVAPPPGSLSSGGEAALAPALGAAVHLFLAEREVGVDGGAEVTRLAPRLAHLLKRELPPALLGEAGRALDERLEAFLASPLEALWQCAAASASAREVPLLVAPGDDPSGPVAARSGVLDLLYRDSASGEWVVADFKTDQLSSPAECSARAAFHAPQLRAYGEAVRRAFSLPRRPRLELWFLEVGEVVAISGEL